MTSVEAPPCCKPFLRGTCDDVGVELCELGLHLFPNEIDVVGIPERLASEWCSRYGAVDTRRALVSSQSGAPTATPVEDSRQFWCPVTGLSRAALQHVYSFLCAEDFGRCRRVSKMWYAAADSQSLWKKFALEIGIASGMTLEVQTRMDWKEAFLRWRYTSLALIACLGKRNADAAKHVRRMLGIRSQHYASHGFALRVLRIAYAPQVDAITFVIPHGRRKSNVLPLPQLRVGDTFATFLTVLGEPASRSEGSTQHATWLPRQHPYLAQFDVVFCAGFGTYALGESSHLVSFVACFMRSENGACPGRMATYVQSS